MASSSFLFVVLCLFCVLSSCVAKTSPRPLLRVTKDAKTLQYITQIWQRTPLVPVKLILNLGGPHMWVNCEQGYTSSTYLPAHCGSAPCRLLNTTSCIYTGTSCPSPHPGCNNNTCQHLTYNPVSHSIYFGDLGADMFKIQSTNVHSVLTIPRFYFVCAASTIGDGLPSGVTGVAGLGRTGASLPAQLSSYFRFDYKFALCLSSSTRSSGFVFFGNVHAPSSLTYTPLILNSDGTGGFIGDASPEYYIGVKSFKINGKRVKGFNGTLLSIDEYGMGGTTISTVDPYTVLETSIYSAVVEAFVKAMPKNVERVPNVAPFGACFSSKNIGSTRLGPAVPFIDLELQSKNVWRIEGANSMVEAKKNVLCLGFVEAETSGKPAFSIVIGGHQIEDVLLKFDLSASRLGFSSSLLGQSTSCASYNFTSIA